MSTKRQREWADLTRRIREGAEEAERWREREAEMTERIQAVRERRHLHLVPDNTDTEEEEQ